MELWKYIYSISFSSITKIVLLWSSGYISDLFVYKDCALMALLECVNVIHTYLDKHFLLPVYLKCVDVFFAFLQFTSESFQGYSLLCGIV
jgi:hypothetical protein